MKNHLPVEDCWFLTGATAVGKTSVAIALAERLDAEIISLDSMAIYRGMDIGTAKPSPEEQRRVPHHLLDIVDPTDEYSVAEYLSAAEEVVEGIRKRGHQPLFVGGTPLYLKALLRGLFEGPPADWEMREQIEKELEEVGQEALHKLLEQVDPLAADAIHPNDTRRLVRALEVYRATGEPISHQQMQFDDSRTAEQCRVFVLRRARELQRERINDRVDDMIERGLIEEVRALTSDGKQLGRTASQAVGYREVIDHLNDDLSEEEMIEKIKARTRRFSKRQGTWFRGLSECRFLDIEPEEQAEEIAERIASVATE
ncbi:tRNA (adenosine(37)-N6)-dimethylallyltransferase MiaA [Adhaeretor mobilis]|uniref:tRNA dimethylallyltransferase n=1 Tax=Adhaeretor mobilis TaxID=1930276 RepID=A0A517MSB1_9BACT|nr:tRNA (adenosine(37)-N6)-dimethylallyltransferase MiaA [Adhaeretor mobilis]QDS97766.1 IPP transferase [Adhaeretor mobilis]